MNRMNRTAVRFIFLTGVMGLKGDALVFPLETFLAFTFRNTVTRQLKVTRSRGLQLGHQGLPILPA